MKINKFYNYINSRNIRTIITLACLVLVFQLSSLSANDKTGLDKPFIPPNDENMEVFIPQIELAIKSLDERGKRQIIEAIAFIMFCLDEHYREQDSAEYEKTSDLDFAAKSYLKLYRFAQKYGAAFTLRKYIELAGEFKQQKAKWWEQYQLFAEELEPELLKLLTETFNKEFTFRKTYWGFTIDQVIAAEDAVLIPERCDEYKDKSFLVYRSIIASLDCSIIYHFTNNKLARAVYIIGPSRSKNELFVETYHNQEKYEKDYLVIKEIFERKHGEYKDALFYIRKCLESDKEIMKKIKEEHNITNLPTDLTHITIRGLPLDFTLLTKWSQILEKQEPDFANYFTTEADVFYELPVFLSLNSNIERKAKADIYKRITGTLFWETPETRITLKKSADSSIIVSYSSKKLFEDYYRR